MSRNVIRIGLLFVLISISAFVLPEFLGNVKLVLTKPEYKAAVATPKEATDLPMYSYADAVASAAPAVVSIKTTKEVPVEIHPLLQDPVFRQFFKDRGDFGDEEQHELLHGLGSGVIVDKKGYILTNNHVIKETSNVLITLADGRTAEAKVIGTDPDSDLAVLKIELDKLPSINVGTSKQLRAGDIVLAIGNSFGFDQTVTQGIISATERTGAELGILGNLLQTDAAINPGNSGGALIAANGSLIGINTAIYSRSGGSHGIGFAIPIDQAMSILKQLIDDGKVIRGYLGVSLQNLTKEIREYIDFKEGDGVYVQAIVRGAPAQKAGLLPGDVITKVNNEVVKDDKSAQNLVASLAPGKGYSVEIFRKGDYLTFTIVLGERTPPKIAPKK